MPRAVSFVLFFGTVLTVLGLVHYYLWARLIRDPALPPGLSRALTIVLVGLYLSIPAAFWLARAVGPGPGRLLVWIAFVWLGILFLSFVVLLVFDLGRGAYVVVSRWVADQPADSDRRRFIARVVAVGVAVVAGGLGLAAVRSGLARVAIREVRVRLQRLPSEMDGMTIVQLTDVHVGPTIRRDFIEQIVERTNQLQADVIAITGDLVDGSVEELREHVAPLARLRARYGVFFVTGNHEYYSGVEEWCAELGRLGIRVLRNERVSIGAGDASFDLVGVDDYSAHQFGNGHGANLARAVAGRDPKRELVLLAHQPRAVFEATKHQVGLQLSGHTHGGQIWPWNFMVRFQQPIVSGLARVQDTFVYVSNGTGYWGPPMRLGAPAEITRVVLQAPEEALV